MSRVSGAARRSAREALQIALRAGGFSAFIVLGMVSPLSAHLSFSSRHSAERALMRAQYTCIRPCLGAVGHCIMPARDMSVPVLSYNPCEQGPPACAFMTTLCCFMPCLSCWPATLCRQRATVSAR